MIARFILLITILSVGSIARAQANNSGDERAIRSQLALYAAASERGEGKSRAAFYAEDAEVWLSRTGQLTRGRKEIARELDRPADPNRRFRLEIENISFFKPDVAFVDAKFYGASSEPDGHAFYVMVERDGAWLIRITRTARFVPPAR